MTLDKDGDGKIDVRDLSAALKECGVHYHYAEVGLVMVFGVLWGQSEVRFESPIAGFYLGCEKCMLHLFEEKCKIEVKVELPHGSIL